MYIYIYICIHTHVYIHACTHTHIHAYLHIEVTIVYNRVIIIMIMTRQYNVGAGRAGTWSDGHQAFFPDGIPDWSGAFKVRSEVLL